MPTLQDLRKQYPMYDDLDDEAFVDGFHKKFYSDMPREELNKRIGYSTVASEPTAEPETAKPSATGSDTLDTAYDATLGVGKGVSMGFLDEIDAGLRAPGTAFREGKSLSDAYTQRLEENRKGLKEAEERSPTASLIGEIGGGLATMAVPGGGAANVARAAQAGTRLARAGQLAARAGKGVATGAGYGAGYGFGTGEGVEDRLGKAAGGAVVGGLVGGASVPVVEGVAKAGQAVAAPFVRSITKPAEEAERRVSRAIQSDRQTAPNARIGDRGLTDQEFNVARAAGFPVTNLERGGETTRRLADAASTRSGEAGSAMNTMLNDRNISQVERYGQMFDSMLPGGGSAEARQAVRTAGQNATRPLYTLANMHPNAQQMWDGGFEQLMQSDIMQKAAKGALSSGTNEAAVRGFNPMRHPFQVQKLDDGTERLSWKEGAEAPNLAFWDQTKKNLDGIIEAGTDVAGKKSFEAKQAIQLKNALVDRLDKIVPSYKTARQGAGRYLGQESASEAAETMFKGGSGIKVDDVRRAVSKWTPEERAQGRVAWLDELRNRSQNIGETHDISSRMWRSPAERQKAALVLSPQDMNQIEAINLVEGLMAKGRNNIQGNSKTIQRAIGQYALSPLALGGTAGAGTAYGTGGDLQSTLGAMSVAGLGRKGQQILGDRLAREAVRILSSNNPAAIRQFTHRIAEDPGVMARLRLLQKAGSVGAGQQGADAF